MGGNRQQTKLANKADAYPRRGLTTTARLPGFTASTFAVPGSKPAGGSDEREYSGFGSLPDKRQRDSPSRDGPHFWAARHPRRTQVDRTGFVWIGSQGSLARLSYAHSWRLARDTTAQQKSCSELKLQYLVESRVESKQSRHSLSWFTLAASSRPK